MQTKVIEFTDGTMKGVKAYVTHEESQYMRVTPIDGDPLWSLEVDKKKTAYKEIE